MVRHGFGRGEYLYFADPLPNWSSSSGASFTGNLAPIANSWDNRLGLATRFPSDHHDYLDRCREAGQAKPTLLLLKYGPGDYHCLHQDLYGEHVFPLPVAVLLSRPGFDFAGVSSR